MSAFIVLRQAIKAVPEVKWALGVAGIVAVIAIVRSILRVDSMVAVLGTIVMIFLMVLLMVFARLSASAGTNFRLPIIVLTWASIILTIATAVLLFTSVFFGQPINLMDRTSPALKSVWDIQDQIMQVRATWEIVNEYKDPINKAKVMELAPKYGDQMLEIPDSKLELRGRLLKYQYACYAFVISADVEPENAKKLAFANTAIDSCEKANLQIETAIKSRDTDKNAKIVADFASTDDAGPRIDYLSAMAECIKSIAAKDVTSQKKVLELVSDRIPSYYKERFPPAKDSVLKNCLSNQIEVTK